MFASLYKKKTESSYDDDKNKKNHQKQQQQPNKKRKKASFQTSSSASSQSNNDNHNIMKKKTQQQQRKHTSSSNFQRKQKHHKPPSDKAIALSSQLKLLSSQKKLQQALDLYYDPSNNDIRDEHHACILIDCCGRCGDIAKGEKIVEEIMMKAKVVNVQTKTALLKGYVHSGMIRHASLLYKEMVESNRKRDRPNVRTLNTFLRGCLWSAATAFFSNNGKDCEIHGGIISSEKSWPKDDENHADFMPDLSSFEYSIILLSQALRIEEAELRVETLQKRFGIINNNESNNDHVSSNIPLIHADDPSTLETLAVSYIALARACALLGEFTKAERYASKVLSFTSSLLNNIKGSTNHALSLENRDIKISGGKRSWKEMKGIKNHNDNDIKFQHQQQQSRRDLSNRLFRQHKLHEIQSEAKRVMEYVSRTNKNDIQRQHRQIDDLIFYLTTRLLYFNGGGTTDRSAAFQPHSKRRINDGYKDHLQLLNSLWNSFGLASAMKERYPNLRNLFSKQILNERDCKSIHHVLGFDNTNNIINDDGLINFSNVFAERANKNTTSNQRPLYLELGSGFGCWAVNQAQRNPSCDYIACELRSDRVSQMFIKAMLNENDLPLNNLCCIGSECGHLLRQRISENTVSKIFINHPEPPTQTYGSDLSVINAIAAGGDEPAHMLTSETISSAIRCLSEVNGELIIVTDNRWYGKLLCATLLKVMSTKDWRLYNKVFDHTSGIRQIETFHESKEGSKFKNKVILYEGSPNETIGHFTAKHEDKDSVGSSYFDRLWRSGAGTHAEVEKRFIICVYRSLYSPSNHMNAKRSTCDHTNHNKANRSKKKPNKKRNAEKQKIRNEKRLLKKQELRKHD